MAEKGATRRGRCEIDQDALVGITAYTLRIRTVSPRPESGFAFTFVDVGSAGGHRYCFDPREVRKMRYGMGGRAASDRNCPTRPVRVGIRQGVSTPTRAKVGRADMLSGGSIA